MSTSLGKIRARPNDDDTSATHDGLVKTPESELPPAPTPDRDWWLELGNTLQTTLDIDTLIKLFSQQADSLVHHESVDFQYDSRNVAISHGAPQRYSCTYDVFLLEDFLGTMTFTRSVRFSEHEIGLLEYMLMGIVHPLRNAWLYTEAIQTAAHDPLTGVNNPTRLDSFIRREIDLARRHLAPLSIIMIQFDKFQSVKDALGQVAGEYALRSAASCVVACSRNSDVVFSLR